MTIGNDKPQSEQDQKDLELLRDGVSKAKERLREGAFETPAEPEKPKRRRPSKGRVPSKR